MAIEVFNRYEYKYLLDEETFKKVTAVLNEHMVMDFYNANGEFYTIANIYYDTEDDYLIRHSLERPTYKEKLRLRAYGIPNKETPVFLEIKKKYKKLVNKRRTTIKLDEAYEFIQNKEKPPISEIMNKQVVNELEYFLKIYDLKPKVYIAYDRMAYFEQGNPDLRISFDKNIRCRRKDLHLENGDYGEKLLNDNCYLMEIKTAKTMPLWLAHMLTEYDIKKQNFSKYGTEFKKNLKKQNKKGKENEQFI